MVALLHGGPDSARTWFSVAPLLAEGGYRALVPALRGWLRLALFVRQYIGQKRDHCLDARQALAVG